ncbi:hypothetical protein AB6A40_003616 [Gnathostoma spinigerum]|uniref:Uncharacterized protein n=1 Tax=Gnathostoma spinigerum TaxID=75299 RepID=A0ABD6EJP1_9BILA
MKNEIEREEMKCRELILQYEKEGINHQSKEIPLQYPSASFVGRALLIDCLPISEYISEYPNGECVDSAGPYVLIFDVFEPLLVPIPHVSPTNDDVYKVDKHLRTAVKHILDPYCFL